ncbi:hypothetical protein BJX66DRAFT_300161 [Aspergillus keveii]|uniref:Zn(2)-C6 fungal-type domain-containing protein n=1 Tax=Aspergillus keveii TaxID=714993 RepID=A0ABR4GAV2_9EURO
MPSRRAHTKSRHGCAPCKAKRIKCDETRPRCGRCTEKELSCSYSSPEWSCTIASVPKKVSPRPSPALKEDPTPAPRRNLETDLGPAELQSLELMAQWCNHTHLTLSRSESVSWIWRSAVPRKASQHPFLMHGILALSALHSAFSSTGVHRTMFLELAQTHHSKAIGGLSRLDRLDAANADAAYALSNIIIIFTFALPLCSQPGGNCDFIDELLKIFHICKGSMKVLMEVHHWVQAGDLALLVSMQEPPDVSSLRTRGREYEGVIAALNQLRSIDVSVRDNNVYSETIEALRIVLESLDSPEGIGAITAAFWFIFRVPISFLGAAENHEPLALAILAHYGVVMHHLRGHWWMGAWGNQLLGQVYSLLDEQWRPCIQWAMDEIGYGR